MAFGTGNVDATAVILECLAEAHFELVKLHTVGAPDNTYLRCQIEMVGPRLDYTEFGGVCGLGATFLPMETIPTMVLEVFGYVMLGWHPLMPLGTGH